MPRDKTLTHKRVIKAAREEFLANGYEGASMRAIGEKAGLTPAGLYRHYKSKEDMFDALVEPAIDELSTWYSEHKTSRYICIDQNATKQELFSNTMIDFMRDVIYPHDDEFKLLFQKAEGTKYSNFIHDMVRIQQKDMMDALAYMRERGTPVQDISEEEMHVIMSAYITALLEPFMHDMPREKMEHCLATIEDFFMPGWQRIMGY